jgi:hypothetical protein
VGMRDGRGTGDEAEVIKLFERAHTAPSLRHREFAFGTAAASTAALFQCHIGKLATSPVRAGSIDS